MPTLLPDKAPSKGKSAQRAAPAPSPAFDWLGIWSLSIGVAAVLVAAVVYLISGDSLNASLVLFGAAALVTLLSQGSGLFDE